MRSYIHSASGFLIAIVILAYASEFVKGQIKVAVYRFQDTAKVTWSWEKPVTKAKTSIAIKYRAINPQSQWINYKSTPESKQAVIRGLQPNQQYSYEVAVFQNNVLYVRKSVTKEVCSNQWRWYNGSCFDYLDSQLASWQDARKLCQKYQGDLVTIWNKSMMDFINTLSVKRYAWIGLKRQSGTFKWTSGVNYNYSYWATGEPIARGRDCVALNPLNPSNGYRWKTQLCSYSYGYVCQAPETPVNSPTNIALIVAITVCSVVVVAIVFCIVFAWRYPTSSLGRGLTKCRTMCSSVGSQQPDFGNSAVKASRLNDEVA